MPGITRTPDLGALVSCPRCHTPIPSNDSYCSNCPPDYTHELRERLTRALEGRYEIIRLLGRGGMAAVFLAHDLVLERQVAIKVLPPDMTRDNQLVTRFQREAKTAARLDHPCIIPIHRVESEAGLVYIVMKYVAGQSLEDLLTRARGHRLPIPQVRHILRDAALALGHAHRRQVVHRDVKPANIMLDEEGRVVVTDFGISKAVEGTTQLTGTGTIIGTPAYMAPEQAKGREVDGRADQYSLAVVGHRALTGKLPFEGDPHSILYQQVFEPPPSLLDRRPDTPRDLRLALERALAKDASARFSTMEQFAASLSGEDPAPAGTTTVVSPAVPTRRMTISAGTDNAAHLVVLGTLIMVLLAVLFGIPRLERIADGTAERRPSVAATPSRRSAKARPVQYASLSVRSTPAGVLYLDGVKVGSTPIANRRLAAGTYRLRIERKGYRTLAETVVLKGGQSISRRYQLRRR
jgi:tRNA A-37 threonylcarbamoyl transferase component Bud32